MYMKIHSETKLLEVMLKNFGLGLVSVKWKGWVPDSDL
jgi:hypothetical protein